jgi:hypothetical protein
VLATHANVIYVMWIKTISPTEPDELGERLMGMRIKTTATVGLLVAGLLLASCSSSRQLPAPPNTTRPVSGSTSTTRPVPLSAEIVLPRHTLRAGASMDGHVVVVNHTGHALPVTGCGNVFQVLLTSPTYHPEPAWLACAQRITVPQGRSTYGVTVAASYLGCTTAQPAAGFPACVHGDAPPLPTGSYRAALFQSGRIVPDPPSVPVEVIG